MNKRTPFTILKNIITTTIILIFSAFCVMLLYTKFIKKETFNATFYSEEVVENMFHEEKSDTVSVPKRPETFNIIEKIETLKLTNAERIKKMISDKSSSVEETFSEDTIIFEETVFEEPILLEETVSEEPIIFEEAVSKEPIFLEETITEVILEDTFSEEMIDMEEIVIEEIFTEKISSESNDIYLSTLTTSSVFQYMDLLVPADTYIPTKEEIQQVYNGLQSDSVVVSLDNTDIIVQNYDLELTDEVNLEICGDLILSSLEESRPNIDFDIGCAYINDITEIPIIEFSTEYNELVTYSFIGLMDLNGKLITISVNSVNQYSESSQFFETLLTNMILK